MKKRDTLKTAAKTRIIDPGDLIWVRNFSQRGKQWLKGRIVKQLSSVIHLVQLKGYDSYVKKQVNQVRYQPIIEIDKVPVQNKTDIIENQLDKSFSKLPLPDHLPLPTSELESQPESQDINILNCSQHREDDISHPIEADTAHEPQNYELNKGICDLKGEMLCIDTKCPHPPFCRGG